jgi:hypothetical protein
VASEQRAVVVVSSGHFPGKTFSLITGHWQKALFSSEGLCLSSRSPRNFFADSAVKGF